MSGTYLIAQFMDHEHEDFDQLFPVLGVPNLERPECGVAWSISGLTDQRRMFLKFVGGFVDGVDVYAIGSEIRKDEVAACRVEEGLVDMRSLLAFRVDGGEIECEVLVGKQSVASHWGHHEC